MTDKAYNGKILKHLRVDLGLSQRQLAEKLGTTQQTIYMVESGNREVPKSILGTLYKEFGLLYVDNRLKRATIAELVPITLDDIEQEQGEPLVTPSEYKVTVTLSVHSLSRARAMTDVLDTMSRAKEFVVDKIEIL